MNGTAHSTAASKKPSTTSTSPSSRQRTSWLSLPAPIRTLFAYFPLQTLPANALPVTSNDAQSIPASTQKSDSDSKSSGAESLPSLYVFSTPAAAALGRPSFNPSCLKWQTWLRLHGVDVRLVSSNNHASPSGALPFLLAAATKEAQTDEGAARKPVTASKIKDWARRNARKRKTADEPKGFAAAREEAYIALVEHRVRAAWLHSLYLTSNFDSVAVPLYVNSATRSSAARLSLATSLRRAARISLHDLSPPTASTPLLSTGVWAEIVDAVDPRASHGLLKRFGVVGVEEREYAVEDDKSEKYGPSGSQAERIYASAEEAFDALAVALGEDDWFFGGKQPGMLDVSLFAYTHLVLSEDLGEGWSDAGLRRLLERESCKNLVRHQERLARLCFE